MPNGTIQKLPSLPPCTINFIMIPQPTARAKQAKGPSRNPRRPKSGDASDKPWMWMKKGLDIDSRGLTHKARVGWEAAPLEGGWSQLCS